MSNFHAKITSENAKFYLMDVGSTNRTWQRLSAEGEQSTQYPLSIGDVIKIGSTVFLVQPNNLQNLNGMPIVTRDKGGKETKVCARRSPCGALDIFCVRHYSLRNLFGAFCCCVGGRQAGGTWRRRRSGHY